MGQDVHVDERFGVYLDGIVRYCESEVDVGMRGHEQVAKRFGKTFGCSGTAIDECVKLVTIAGCKGDS